MLSTSFTAKKLQTCPKIKESFNELFTSIDFRQLFDFESLTIHESGKLEKKNKWIKKIYVDFKIRYRF